MSPRSARAAALDAAPSASEPGSGSGVHPAQRRGDCAITRRCGLRRSPAWTPQRPGPDARDRTGLTEADLTGVISRRRNRPGRICAVQHPRCDGRGPTTRQRRRCPLGRRLKPSGRKACRAERLSRCGSGLCSVGGADADRPVGVRQECRAMVGPACRKVDTPDLRI